MGIVYLISSVLASTFINLIFRWFKVYKVDKLQAIVINYITCFLLGFLFSDNKNLLLNISSEWFLYCVLLGFLFIIIFLAMAYTTEQLSISVTAVSSKMAVVVPILFAYFFSGEQLSYWFIGGLVLSLVSIFLISAKSNLHVSNKLYALPIIVFMGSGIIDTALKVLENAYSDQVNLATLSYSIFLGAALAGSLFFVIQKRGKVPTITWHNVKAGIILGVPNYFSIWFLLSAIQAFTVKSSFVFGLNNVSIVLLSTLLSVILFKEHLNVKNKIGIALAALSIFIIAYVS